jgi:hypothetical protein
MTSKFYHISDKVVHILCCIFLYSIKAPSRRFSTDNVKQQRVHYVDMS